MEKLDLKDRKILYYLDLDSRQSFRSLGKKVGLSKDIVASRVKKLKELGIIRNFYTRLDTSKFGYSCYRIYIKYQYLTPDKKKEIIDYFVKTDLTAAVHSNEGHYDLGLIFIVKDIIKFNNFWENTLYQYRDYFLKQVFSIMIKHKHYDSAFLIPDENIKNINRIETELYGAEKSFELDNLDNNILKLLSTDSRIPTVDISNKLKSSTTTIKNRINNLVKLGIIQGFKLSIDFSKLDYKWYKVDINLKNPKKSQKIFEYILKNPNFKTYIKSIGYVDLEFVFVLRTVQELNDLMEDLIYKFPDTIKNYVYFCTINTHKWNEFPEE
jgi:DNA-binding Lrp family transcriptional regulator